jgi:hypothetical protein
MNFSTLVDNFEKKYGNPHQFFFVTWPMNLLGVMWYSTVFPTLFSRKLFERALPLITSCSHGAGILKITSNTFYDRFLVGAPYHKSGQSFLVNFL